MAATRKAAARTRAAVIPFPQAGRIDLARLLPSWRTLAVTLAAIAVVAGAYSTARFTPLFAVETVEVRGASPGLAAQVGEAVAEAEGQSLLAVDLGRLEGRVLDIPTVAGVSWDRAFPDRLVVTVEPERPAAVLRRGADAWLLSDRGRILRPLARGARGALPRIWVPRAVDVALGDHVRERTVVDALRALRPVPDDFPVGVRSATAGDSLAFELTTGLELRLGTDADLPLKLAVAASIVTALPSPAAGGPAYLDVSVPERPVTGQNPQVED